MKRLHVVAGIVLILASSLAIEWYTNSRFPTHELTITGVPELVIGETRTFSYQHEMENVGTYSYTITGKEDGLYTMLSVTNVRQDEGSIQLESHFMFDEQYNPEDYRLIVQQGNVINKINVTFSTGQVVSVVDLSEDVVTLTDEVDDDILVTENNMPGLWEILLLSSKLESGERYKADVYIPQGGTVFELEFYVNPEPTTITVKGEQLSCTVVQESTLDLRFFLYEGEMVEMRNDDTNLVFTRTN